MRQVNSRNLPIFSTTPLRVVVAAACLAFVTLTTHAQAPGNASAAGVPHKSTHVPKRTRSTRTQPAPQEPDPAPATPPAPEIPKWPANEKPGQAAITWDSKGLRIDAANSSLQQIMRDVSTATGVKVEGLSNDERIFGAYGPGQARDVLSQLLQGSGYNVLMIGDMGQGAPRQILLSSRNAAAGAPQPGADPNANGQNNGEEDAVDNEVEDQQQPPQQLPMRPNFPPGAPQRTPQQIMQEMQMRQLQLQQRVNPPNQ